MTQSQVFASTFFEKQLLPRTLMNDFLSKLLTQGMGTAISFALTPFWVCKLKKGLLFAIIFFLLTTYCDFSVQKNKFHENFPRTIELEACKIFVNTIMEILKNININANYSEIVGRSSPWLFNNRSSLKLWIYP